MKVDYKFLKTVANSTVQEWDQHRYRANNFINTIYYSRIYVLDVHNI